ncbi:integrator complex assembly factor WDR73 isoform 2-T2 [Aulostomus maculatus]
MEDSEFDEVLDDWFIESLKTYKDLHVYQLEFPTQVIEWTSGKSFHSQKNELLELRLPLKLFADENKGLCAERDFKVVNGGFADGPVSSLRHVPGTRCVVTNDGRSSDLQVWDLGGDYSDVIRRTAIIEGRRPESGMGSKMAARRLSQPSILHGGQSDVVQLTGLASGQTLYQLATDATQPLNSLHFLSDHVFLAACCNGSVYIADSRTSSAAQRLPPPDSSGGFARWWMDAAADDDPSSCRVVRLSSSGQVEVSELRRPGGAGRRAQLDVQTHCCNMDNVRVSWAPMLDDSISVSGFGGGVQIYNTSGWGAELQEARPLFEHRGHVVSHRRDDGVPVNVTAHIWHPERLRTLLSAASDGSVHVWEWVDQSPADAPTPSLKML